MGDLTLTKMRDELAVIFKNRQDADFTSTTRQNLWINNAYDHLCHPGVYHFREMQTTFTTALVASTFEYSVDATTVGFKILGIRYGAYYQSTSTSRDPTVLHWNLEPISQYQMDERQMPSTNAGEPRQYSIDGTTVTLSQIPTSTEAGRRIHWRAWREPVPLSADGDTTVIPRVWDLVLLKGAKWFAMVDFGYTELAEQAKQEYAALINEYGGQGLTEELEAEDEGFSTQFITRGYYGQR